MTINNLIEEEFEKSADILWLNFTDSYKNLTLKTYGLLSYAKYYCPKIRCLLKADSDMIVNIEGFEKLCYSLPSMDNIQERNF